MNNSNESRIKDNLDSDFLTDEKIMARTMTPDESFDRFQEGLKTGLVLIGDWGVVQRYSLKNSTITVEMSEEDQEFELIFTRDEFETSIDKIDWLEISDVEGQTYKVFFYARERFNKKINPDHKYLQSSTHTKGE